MIFDGETPGSGTGCSATGFRDDTETQYGAKQDETRITQRMQYQGPSIHCSGHEFPTATLPFLLNFQAEALKIRAVCSSAARSVHLRHHGHEGAHQD